MSPQSYSLTERFVQLYSSVCHQMFLQITSLNEWFVALCTFLQIYSGVGKDVHLHMIRPTKWNVTLCTFVQLYFSVGKEVALQLMSMTKWFVTLCTFVQLFYNVCQQMPGKIAGIWKLLEAYGARVFAGHRSNVCGFAETSRMKWKSFIVIGDSAVKFLLWCLRAVYRCLLSSCVICALPPPVSSRCNSQYLMCLLLVQIYLSTKFRKLVKEHLWFLLICTPANSLDSL